MQSGTDKESLIKVIQEMSEVTGIDRLVSQKDMIKIRGRFLQGRFHWTLEAEYARQERNGKIIEKGRGHQALLNALNEQEKSEVIREQMLVLVLIETRMVKHYDGLIETVWAVFDPCEEPVSQRLEIGETTASRNYPLIPLRLTAEEYRLCTGRLALYDEFDEILYPIQDCAYPALGTLLDASLAFHYLKRVPLSAAAFLAECISAAGEIHFLYRIRTERVRPLLSIFKKNYAYYNQKMLVEELFSLLQSQMIWHIEYWEVTDEWTQVIIAIDNYNLSYHPQLEIRISDVNGNSMSVTAGIRIGKGTIHLHKNRSYHCSSFRKRGGAVSLLDGVLEAIQDFESRCSRLQGKKIWFQRADLDSYYEIIGKKRMALVTLPKDGMYDCLELLELIVDGTYFPMSRRWSKELAKENFHFFERLEKNGKTI